MPEVLQSETQHSKVENFVDQGRGWVWWVDKKQRRAGDDDDDDDDPEPLLAITTTCSSIPQSPQLAAFQRHSSPASLGE